MMGAPTAPTAQPGGADTPTAAGNPMQAMMQQVMSNPQMMQQAMQMMSNPQAMQQMMQMRQGLGMGAPGGGMFGNFGMPPATLGAATPTPVTPVDDAVIRMRFGSQLAQLA